MAAPRPLPAHRRRQEDPKRSRALTRSTVGVVVSFVGGFAAFVAMKLVGVPRGSSVYEAIGTAIIILILASSAYTLWTYVSLRIYRCPRCRGKTVTVEQAHPAIHRYCATCNVEWITGLKVGDPLD